MCLLQMKEGDSVEVDALNVTHQLKARFASLGIAEHSILMIKNFGIFKSTVQVQVNNTLLALRKNEAQTIEVHKVA